MYLLESLAQWDWWYVAGWTMLHYLWLGALVGVAASVSGFALRRAGANVRYATALVWLMVLAMLPIGVGVWVGGFGSQEPGVGLAAFNADGEVSELPLAVPSNPTSIALAPSAPGSAGGIVHSIPDSAAPSSIDSVTSNEPSLAVDPNTVSNSRQSRGLTAVSEIAAGYLPWLWIIGTPLTFVLLATGIVGAERLRRGSRALTDGPIAECAARIARTLAIGRRVTVAVCERVAAPVLVGIVRPMILLPPAALTGWSPEEIEMVLLHELAHVRRWDNLVNLAQRIVEAALFFQPAVWLVSRWVRREREACCDAVVVGETKRPQAYAELLVALAAQLPRSVLFHPAATSAMAAGPIRNRIRRVMGIDDDPMLISGKSLGVVMAGLLLVATLAVLNLPTNSKAQESSDTASADAPNHRNEVRAQENESLSNLKDLVIAIHEYENERRRLPPMAAFDSAGKPLLSWRVLLLPYLGEMELFKEFHMGEPWDSEHNRKLVARMPEVFKNPRIDRAGYTNYLAVVGNDCVFDGTRKGIRFAEITDGTSKTIALVEADADRAVEWTKPADWQFDREHPTAGLGSLWKDQWLAAWSDARALPVLNSEPDENVRAYFTRRGDEVVRTGDGPEYADAFGGMDRYGGEMEMGRGGEFAASESPSAAGPALVDVPFVVGASRFEDGDRIEIIDVRGTSDTFAKGNVYWIKGKYTLASHDRAQLSAFTTARNAAEGRSSTQKIQTTTVDRGSGEFTLWLPMTVSGWPHVSFYPDGGGNGFGGAYFGTGKSVLNKWWDEENRTTASTEEESAPERMIRLREIADLQKAKNRIEKELAEVQTDLLKAERQMSEPRDSSADKNNARLRKESQYHADILRMQLKIVSKSLNSKMEALGNTTKQMHDSEHSDTERPTVDKGGDSPENAERKFPTLEEQKLADAIYRRLGLEIEPLSADELRRVQALGYDGGMKVTQNDGSVISWETSRGGILPNDILVGLHVWPTKSAADVVAVLERDDLAELSPLKFYLVRPEGDPHRMKGPLPDKVVTGRIPVRVSASKETEKEAQSISAYSPRVVEGTATPIPLGSMKSTANDAQINEVVDESLASDPTWSTLLQEFMLLQHQLEQVQASTNNVPSGEGDRLRLLIAAQHRKIDAYRWQMRGQPSGVRKSQGLPVPTIPNAVNSQSDLSPAEPVPMPALPRNAPPEPTTNLHGTSNDDFELRYDGKTFDQWRTAWQTELSLEKRLEVVKALAAFGASGQGREAAEAILDVANQLDWSFISTETAAGQLKQACVDAFVSGRTTEGYRIPTEAWWPLVIPLYENSADKKTIVTYLSYQLPAGETDLVPKLLELSNENEATRNLALSGLKAIDPKLEDDRVVARFRESLKDADQPPAELRGAITNLFYYRSSSGGYGPQPELRWVPELQLLLFHADPEVRQTARFAISKAEPRDAAHVVESLIESIGTHRNDQECQDAIRALAALGQRATPAEEKLKAIARDPNDSSRIAAAVALLALWPDIANWDSQSKFNKLFGQEGIKKEQWDDISRKLKAEQDVIFGIYTQNLGSGGGFF